MEHIACPVLRPFMLPNLRRNTYMPLHNIIVSPKRFLETKAGTIHQICGLKWVTACRLSCSVQQRLTHKWRGCQRCRIRRSHGIHSISQLTTKESGTQCFHWQNIHMTPQHTHPLIAASSAQTKNMDILFNMTSWWATHGMMPSWTWTAQLSLNNCMPSWMMPRTTSAWRKTVCLAKHAGAIGHGPVKSRTLRWWVLKFFTITNANQDLCQ